MAITRFSALDPYLSSSRPNLSSGTKFEFQDRETMEDEKKEISKLSNEGLLERKHETEKVIHELRVRLSVCEIDYRRRLTEAAEKTSRELEEKDRHYNVHVVKFLQEANDVYQTLIKAGVSPVEAKRRVSKMLELAGEK